MPPKLDPALSASRTELFQKVGLNQARASEVAKNPKLAPSFEALILKQQLIQQEVSSKQSNLLLHLVTVDATLDEQKQAIVAASILQSKLTSADQVSGKSYIEFPTLSLTLRTAAVTYCKEHESFNQADFEKAAGVGA